MARKQRVEAYLDRTQVEEIDELADSRSEFLREAAVREIERRSSEAEA